MFVVSRILVVVCCMLYVVIMYVDEQELTLHYCTDWLAGRS